MFQVMAAPPQRVADEHATDAASPATAAPASLAALAPATDIEAGPSQPITLSGAGLVHLPFGGDCPLCVDVPAGLLAVRPCLSHITDQTLNVCFDCLVTQRRWRICSTQRLWPATRARLTLQMCH